MKTIIAHYYSLTITHGMCSVDVVKVLSGRLIRVASLYHSLIGSMTSWLVKMLVTSQNVMDTISFMLCSSSIG